MLGFLDRLTAGQRQVVVGLASLLGLLALAVGVVALAGDDIAPQAVQTQGVDPDPSSTTRPGSASSSSSSSSTSTTAPDGGEPAGGVDGSDPDRPAERGRAAPTGGQASSTTRARTTGGGAGGGSSSGDTGGTGGARDGGGSGGGTGAPPATAVATGCTTGGTGGPAGEMASRYCAHRVDRGATAHMGRSARLDQAARDWAQELVRRGELAHGSYQGPVAEVCPSCTGGENVAVESPGSTAAAWTRWLQSPPHRAHLDDPRGGFYGTGAAVAGDGRTTYYVHVFAWKR